MFLIVGLGNPGTKYQNTRHNLGFMLVDSLARKFKARFTHETLFWYARAKYRGSGLILLKPMTYMNLSGKAVTIAINKFKVDLSQLLVICDDINLPLGKLRIRGKGSDGGHNGLASIIEELGTIHFPRLRMGIGSDFPPQQMVDFVLSQFADQELKIKDEMISVGCKAVLCFIENGLEITMNRFN